VELRQKKQKRCTVEDGAEAGDVWDHTAIAAESKLLVSLVVGKRTHEQTRALVHDAKKRLRPGHLPAIFTDAYDGYTSAIREAFGRRYPTPSHSATGQSRRSVLRWLQGLAYGQVKKHYKGCGVERVEVRVAHGKARLKYVLYLLGYKVINTRVVERHNGTSRWRNQRKVRKTLAFSKATRYHHWMSWLAAGLYNVCHAHRSLKIKHEGQVSHQSPAMAAKLTDHIWSTGEWLRCLVLGG
jgi:IS1 family transposase